MIKPTSFIVDTTLFKEIDVSNLTQMKTAINRPTGNFFYDPWEIKPEYRDTVWERLLSYIESPIGEARIIVLEAGKCYFKHSDIDDRWHLNLTGNEGYLINIDNKTMYHLTQDGVWYDMDASPRHSAACFGGEPRAQLVVRKLLNRTKLKNPINIKLVCIEETHARYSFDNSVSSWLNQQNKDRKINNFMFDHKGTVTLEIENELVDQLNSILPQQFILEKL